MDIRALLQDYCTREAEVNPPEGKVAEISRMSPALVLHFRLHLPNGRRP